MLLVYLRQSQLIKGGVYFSNDECTRKLPAACALLIQSSALLVNVNIKLAYTAKKLFEI
jgi:hypothetical protein